MKNLKAGDWVKIFEDPMTCKRYEDQAQLIAKQATCGASLESWTVRFRHDDQIVMRAINTDNN